ncbi:MAG: TSUP family transporter [Nocardioidaceae bacterium]
MAVFAGVAVAVAAGAAAQTVTGIGLVLVCGPVLVLLVGPAEAVRVALVVSLALNVVLVARQPAGVQLRQVGRLALPGAAAVVVLGVLLRDTGDRLSAGLAGVAMLIAAALMWRGHRWPWLSTPGGTLTAGAASGAMNVVCAVGGPFAALYAVNSGWTPGARVVTLQAYFAVVNIIALATLGFPRHAVALAAAGAGLAVGVLIGRSVARRLAASHTRRLVLLLAAAGGATVLVQALT